MANSGNSRRPDGGSGSDQGQDRQISAAEQRARERLERQRAGGGRQGARAAAAGGRQAAQRQSGRPVQGRGPRGAAAGRQQQVRAGRPPAPRAPGRRARGKQSRGLSSTSKTAGIFGGTLVLVAVVVIVLISTLGGGNKAKPTRGAGISPYPPKPAPASVVNALADVSSSELETAGLGGGQVIFVNGKSGSVQAISGQKPLTENGKPLIVYVGAEYCPYCAATRWGLVVALDKFGSFSGLQVTASSPVDVAPDTHTLDFAKATYTSKYLAFSATEELGNSCSSVVPNTGTPPPQYVCSGSYPIVQRPSKFVQSIYNTYDSAKYWGQSAGSIPFIDMGNRYVQVGSPYSSGPPESLAGLSWAQIAGTLTAPGVANSPGQAILGLANHYIAAFCSLISGSKPAVCSLSSVKAAAATLK